MLIGFDYCADGIWWVTTKAEQEAKTYEEWRRLTRAQHRPARLASHRPWGDLLSDELLDDLKTWNDSHDYTVVQENEQIVPHEVLQERGRELAIRVQNELGTDGWEVLYHLGGRVHRVCPPGSWPAETWQQDLLGYAPPDHAAHHEEFDYAASDVLLPHPIYASQGWVSILNPGERMSSQLRRLLDDAHSLAARRYMRRTEAR